ncbi:MAG: nitroreductase family protein [Candidatus Marinimicrobia bacterium]|nr:nitroreductase family protein [Candidatus Neomarinimicrobiota bacterium]
MKKINIVIIAIAIIGTGIGEYFMLPQLFGDERDSRGSINASIKLPEPKYGSSVSIEQAMHERRSVRAYQDAPLTLSEVAQVLWSAQGITDPKRAYRTAPSAGTLLPRLISGAIDPIRYDKLSNGVEV